MRLEPTDEQQFLRDAVRGVLGREATPAAVRRWAFEAGHAEPHAIAVRQGWTGVGIPEEAGGQGGGLMELVILAEELGRAAMPADPLFAAALAALLLAGQQDSGAAALVRANAEGDRATVIGQRAGAPLDAPSPEPRLHDGHADGPTGLVLAADGSASLLLARPGPEDIDLFRVALDPPHARVQARALVDRTRAVADVELTAAPAEPIGRVTRSAAARTAAQAAVIIAADGLGAAQRMLELSTEYVMQREQFGVPVGSFQAVKHAAAEMLVDVEATRSAVLYAAWALDADAPDADLSAWIAKAHGSAAIVRVADRALFLHGAVGFTWEHDLQLLFKRAKSAALLFGSGDRYRDRIADELQLTPAA
jgi:alkylation response protein AidB-like acyl-CoA dehydrogenase